MTITTEVELQNFLAERTAQHWKDSEGQPYPLSRVPLDLKEEKSDYKSIIFEEKLKDFVRRTQHDRLYKLVEHPVQKAKVGIIPPDENFEFPIDPIHSEQAAYGPDYSDRGDALFAFLRALSKLPKEDIDAVVIPTRVLVKLAGRK